jgi:DNA-binding NtrC family response regulator
METILIVDDNADLRWNLSNILKEEGYHTRAVSNGKQALREINKHPPDLVLLDIRLSGEDGMVVLKKIKQINKNMAVIMLTAFGEVKGAVKAMKLGAFDYITKPFDNEELGLLVRKALQAQYLSREVAILRKRLGERIVLEDIMGNSHEIKQVLKQVKIIAPTNMTVIIQGESGVGKEVIAHLVHHNSIRKDRAFIPVDCGTIPGTLAESELFGYEKGAFTGADTKKTGKFEQADGGTLFLDEITNLSENMQMKLLRVIQERKLYHLGGKKQIEIDVRIIVATNISLTEAIRDGKFRADLFHRLNEFQIDLPLLRDRQADIPLLARHFLEEANDELDKKIKGFTAEAMRKLLNYNWPGNVRELKNAIKRAVLLAASANIIPDDLPENIVSWRDGIQSSSNISQDRVDLAASLKEGVSFEEITREVERDLINKALEQSGGKKAKAAEILGMSRKTLYRKLKSLGLSEIKVP